MAQLLKGDYDFGFENNALIVTNINDAGTLTWALHNVLTFGEKLFFKTGLEFL